MLPTDPSRDKNFYVVREGSRNRTILRAQHEPLSVYGQDGVVSELVWRAHTCTTRRKESSLNVIKPRQQIFHINDLNIIEKMLICFPILKISPFWDKPQSCQKTPFRRYGFHFVCRKIIEATFFKFLLWIFNVEIKALRQTSLT